MILDVLDMMGTAVFAVTGALAAGRKQMDVFGVVVLGCVTALGGGTLRDMLLGIRPVFWVAAPSYLAVATLAAVGTFLAARRFQLPSRLLVYADAVGLAVFTVIGFQRSMHTFPSYSVAAVMGMTTGVVGGMARDILAGEIPLILRREIYASASLCGAALLAVLSAVHFPAPGAALMAGGATLALRLAAVRWNLSLPLFRSPGGREGGVS